MKSFTELFWHYFHIYLVFKEHYLKNIPQDKRKVICEQFGKELHLPERIVCLLKSGVVGLNQLDGLDPSTLGAVETISEEKIINAFSHLTII